MLEIEIIKNQLLVPKLLPPLEPEFRPAVLAWQEFKKIAQKEGHLIAVAFERSDGTISRFNWWILNEDHPRSYLNFFFLERLIKFALWSRGGWRIILGGISENLYERIKQHYQSSPTGQFDAWIMGGKIYEKPFTVDYVKDISKVPEEKEMEKPLGGYWDGCRIGFDLGASDIKVAAVHDGRLIYSDEFPWNPRSFTDPQQHFDYIMNAIRQAAQYLPRVDAIGGSAAGVYVNNEVKVASLFRGIPEELFNKRVKRLFFEIQHAWGNIPFEIANDGDVAALAGAQSTGRSPMLGIAMGSSEAAGYVNSKGFITGWLNELAFAPIDYALTAPIDEWSKDIGCGAQYFSQQCLSRLIPRAKLQIPSTLSLPDQLVALQEAMEKGDDRAKLIYETIGIEFGYTIAFYKEFYDFWDIIVMGRVLTGKGGDIILTKAKEVLKFEFPEIAQHITIHVPDEKMKRHGQAMAAASLPKIS